MRDLRARTRRILIDDNGASAVEFGLVALPLFALILVVFEIALMFWMGQVLDNAVEIGARRISTNTLPPVSASDPSRDAQRSPADALRQEICSQIGGLFRCDLVRVNLRSFSSLGGASLSQPIDPRTGEWASGFGNTFECPRSGAVVVLQAAFEFIGFSGLSLGHSEHANGNRVIQSAFTFRMENGQGSSATCPTP
ncbi:MAG: pilus assembly protein [Methylobacterium sp.]|uniref:TadE/TadG family type IV pilus assembly protein n=1 Tax=Methylobacterium sp. TaxID=409 RepID=UPI0025F93A02|nr:TadE/TadG family type IV pilus assembly protein [Methylobacterium sp.]MBX9930826.1 pilus assembly protein [Methylobacterium sp.]